MTKNGWVRRCPPSCRGSEKIDFLVNTAASFISAGLEATPAEWDRVLGVNVKGCAASVSIISRHMPRGSAIVNVGSISAHIAQANRWTYNATKAAIVEMTKCQALDLARRGVRVNAVSPGWIWTPEVSKAAGGDRARWEPIWGRYHILERLGEPEEVANAIIFLLSSSASFITATELMVDGGYLALSAEGLGDAPGSRRAASMVYRPQPTKWPVRVDLRSDTMTRPTAGMRRAIADAAVGDEQLGEDPSVNELVQTVAQLLGKPAAVFLPSGTMCNEIALVLHCRPGDEFYCDRTAHPLHAEAGGPAALAGAQASPIDGERGIYSAEQLAVAISPVSRYAPRPRLTWVEQTANLAGGTIWRREDISAVVQLSPPTGWRRTSTGRGCSTPRSSPAKRRRRWWSHSIAFGSISPKDLGHRWVLLLPGTRTSSTKRGGGNNASAGPCAKPVSSPPRQATPWPTTSIGSSRTTPGRVGWQMPSRKCLASSSTRATSRPTL